MSLEQQVRVTDAARKAGVTTRTFRRWLARLGFTFPPKGPGRRTLLVPEQIAQRAIEKHSGRLVWPEDKKGVTA